MMCMGVLPLLTTTMLRSGVFRVNATGGRVHDNGNDFGNDFRKAGLQRPQGGSHARADGSTVSPCLPNWPVSMPTSTGVKVQANGTALPTRNVSAAPAGVRA